MEIWRRELSAFRENVERLKELDKLIDLRYDILTKGVRRLEPREVYWRLLESTILRKMVRWYYRKKIKELVGELNAKGNIKSV